MSKCVLRRRTARVPFVAYAEIADESGTRISVRVSELSLSGCYVDMLNVLPVGTAVVIRISTTTRVFEAKATVIYSHPNLGMGISFSKLEQNSREVLEKWLAAALLIVAHFDVTVCGLTANLST